MGTECQQIHLKKTKQVPTGFKRSNVLSKTEQNTVYLASQHSSQLNKREYNFNNLRTTKIFNKQVYV